MERSAYQERAERRRRSQGAGEARGDGWVRTAADDQLLRLATRYGTLTLHQAAAACWRGREESARARIRLMAEAGLLRRFAITRWSGTVVWTTERGARIAGVGLGAPRPPGERLLHRLALADTGLALEAAGYTVLTEREVRTAEASGRAAELLADLGVPDVHARARRGELLGVTAGARAVHWPDLVLVTPTGRLIAVEVELTPKTTSALRTILGPTGRPGARSCMWAPNRSSASCRAAPARTATGSTGSPRTSACCRPAGPPRAPARCCGCGRSPPPTQASPPRSNVTPGGGDAGYGWQRVDIRGGYAYPSHAGPWQRLPQLKSPVTQLTWPGLWELIPVDAVLSRQWRLGNCYFSLPRPHRRPGTTGRGEAMVSTSNRRRLARTAAFALVRGAATALGGALVTGLVWWAQQR